MEVGDAAAWAAAGIAVVAAWIALHNANSAKRQAGAAEEQARYAKEQASAAREQVELMREQHADARAEQDMRMGPIFVVEEAVLSDEETPNFSAKIMMRMESGPRLRKVEVAVRGSEVRGAYRNPDIEGREPAVFHDVSPGNKLMFYTSRDACMAPINAAAVLTCTEDGERGRTWERSYGLNIVEPPPRIPPWR